MPQDRLADEGAPQDTGSTDSAAYDDLIGKTVAHNYHLVRRIGAGGMGRVYEAEQLSLGKRVAIKILRREFMGDERVLTRFELEARAASAINHPNLVQVFDCGRDVEADLVYIAMELLPGNDLAQLIQRDWPLPLQRVVHIIDDVLAALDEAHAQGIVHRDLKPGNIMLVPRRNQADLVKVLDFGIAKAPQSRGKHNPTMAGFVFGTPEYMAPEQARGTAVDGRTDLYAVAAILYQLLTGEIPLPATSPPEILARLLRDEPERPSAGGRIHLPEALEDLVMRGLSKAPEDRPQSASQFRDELRAALVGIVDWWPGQTGTHQAAGPVTPPAMRAAGSPVTTRPAVLPAGRLPGTTPPGAATPRPRAPLQQPGAVNAVPVTYTEPPPRKSRGMGLLVLVVVGVGGFLAAGKAQLLPAAWNPLGAPKPGVSAAPASAPAATRTSTPTSSHPAASTSSSALAEAKLANAEPAAEDKNEPSEATEPHADSSDGNNANHAKKSAGTAAPSKGRNDRNVRRVATAERHGTVSHGESGPSTAPVAVAVAAPAPTAPAAVNEDKPAVEPRNVREEPMKEAERLLSQGEVEQACRKGEEARHASPKTPSIYKFLGKCYMRAGKAGVAQDNYRKYLELAPDAPDGAFIRSYVK